MFNGDAMSGIETSTTDSLFALYRAGRFGELADQARALLAAHPRELILHTLLGAACLELGDQDTAIASYRAALEIRPGFAKAHNSLGIALLRCGRLNEATASFRNAMEADPRFAEPRFNLGIVYENGRRPREAAEQYEQAVALNPGYTKAWSALANVCWELGDYGRTPGFFRRALACDKEYLPAHRGLMQFLEQSNRHEELREAVAGARSALGADHPLVLLQQGLAAAAQGDNRKARALLESCGFDTANSSGRHDERMRLAHLAGICDKLDDTARAMGYAAEANRLSAQLSAAKGIGKTGFLEFIENRRRYFQPDRVARWRVQSSDSIPAPAAAGSSRSSPALQPANAATPAFVIGFPRSGTTLLDTLLRGHPRIEVAEECDAAPAMVNRLSGASDAGLADLGSLSPGAIENARAVYLDRLNQHLRNSAAAGAIAATPPVEAGTPAAAAEAGAASHATGANRSGAAVEASNISTAVGESKPGAATDAITAIDRFALNIVYAGEIHRVFPGARFILMLRHPADCVLSCYLRTFTETSANASFHTLEEAVYLYDRVFRLWTQYNEVLNLNVIEVKYENLVENVERACRPVLEFLELPWHPGILDHERTARNRPFIRTASYNQVIQPVYSQASGRRLRYRDHLEPVLPTLEPWIERFGYGR